MIATELSPMWARLARAMVGIQRRLGDKEAGPVPGLNETSAGAPVPALEEVTDRGSSTADVSST